MVKLLGALKSSSADRILLINLSTSARVLSKLFRALHKCNKIDLKKSHTDFFFLSNLSLTVNTRSVQSRSEVTPGLRFEVNIHTYILQIKLKLLLVGLKFTGQLIALVVECKQTLQEGQ